MGFSYTKVNSAARFIPTRRYRIITPIYLGRQLGVDTSNLSLGDIPTSDPFFAGLQDHWYPWHMVYMWWFHFLNYSLDILVSSGYESDTLRRKKTSGNILIQGYACLKFKCSLGTTRIVHRQSTATWDIRYIYKGFLAWIIPSMY